MVGNLPANAVRPLVRKDPTCRGAVKPTRHNSLACVLEPGGHSPCAHVPQLPRPGRPEPTPTTRAATLRGPLRSTQQWPLLLGGKPTHSQKQIHKAILKKKEKANEQNVLLASTKDKGNVFASQRTHIKFSSLPLSTMQEKSLTPES